MSARRVSVYLEPAIGLPVRLNRPGDPQDGAMGWILAIEGHTARVEFTRGLARRWFTWEELCDERVLRTEHIIDAGRALVWTTGLTSVVDRLQDQLDGLDWLERETWQRRTRELSGC